MSTLNRSLLHGLAVIGSLAAVGCMGNPDEFAGLEVESEQGDLVQAEEEEPSASQGSAVAAPGQFGGYFADGVGAFLSADQSLAELTLYVVTPAGRTTFKHPSLFAVVPHGDNWSAEAQDFEDVTLEPGESRAFQLDVNVPLMKVVANFEY